MDGCARSSHWIFLLSKWQILLIGWTHVLNGRTYFFLLILCLILLKFRIMRVRPIWCISIILLLSSSILVIFFIVIHSIVCIWERNLLLWFHWIFVNLFRSATISISWLGSLVDNLQSCIWELPLAKLTVAWGAVPCARSAKAALCTCSELISWFGRKLAWVFASAKWLWRLALWSTSHKVIVLLLMIWKSIICRICVHSRGRMPICVKYNKVIILRNVFT